MTTSQQAQMAELDRLEAEARKTIALASPLNYATYHNTNFLSPPHVQLMSDTIVRLTNDKLLKPNGTPYKRLMINMPPRHGKSELVTRATPPWFLTNWPEKRVIVTGYESEFAADFGADARNYIASHPELGVSLDPSTSSKSNWGLAGHVGGLKTAGAGGPITGKGAHLFLIDDPVKGAEEADSDTYRAKLWTWWQGTIIPRLEPGGYIIMIMTRWHEDDIAGRCLLNEPEEWAQLSFPAIADHAEGLDRLGRAPGEPLWPERYPLEYLETVRNGMGSRWWNAEYMQRPTIEGGNMFKAQNFRYWVPVQTAHGLVYSYQTPGGVRKEVRDDQIWKFTTLDLAATESKKADFTVGAVWGVTPDRELLLLDLVRERMESAKHEDFVRRLSAKHKVRYHGVEKATYGLTLIQVCQRMGLPVLELKPDKDKVARAWPAVGFIENGAIYFPRSTPWLSAFETELQQFPNAANDDMVDVLAYAARHLSEQIRPPREPKAPPPPPNTVSVDAIIANRKRKRQIRNQSSNW